MAAMPPPTNCFQKAPKLFIIVYLTLHFVESAWIDQKAQKLLGPLKQQLRSATVPESSLQLTLYILGLPPSTGPGRPPRLSGSRVSCRARGRGTAPD